MCVCMCVCMPYFRFPKSAPYWPPVRRCRDCVKRHAPYRHPARTKLQNSWLSARMKRGLAQRGGRHPIL